MATQFNNLPKGGGEISRLEDGTYPARIVQVAGLGNQVQTDWKTNDPIKDEKGNIVIKPEVWVTFEFPTETYETSEGVRPHWLSKRYTLSFNNKANFKHLVDALAPGANTFAELLDKAATVTVGSTASNKAKVIGVAAPMKGMEVGALVNPPVYFDFNEPDSDAFNALPDFLQDIIKAADNYQDGMVIEASQEASEEEDPMA